MHICTNNWSLLAEISSLYFVGPFDLISILYANIQNPLRNFVALALMIHSKFQQTPIKTAEEERNFVRF